MLKSKILSQLRNRLTYVALLVLLFRLIEVHYVYLLPFMFVMYFIIRSHKILLIYTGCIVLLILIQMFAFSIERSPLQTAYVKGDIKSQDITSFTVVRYGMNYKVYTDQTIQIKQGKNITC